MAYPTGALVAVDSAGYEIRTTKYALQTMTDVTPSLETLIAAVGPENAILDLSPPGPGPHNAPSARLDAAMVTRRLNRVIDYQPDDMTVTVEAGLTLAELQETLGRRRQFLPLDPPLAGRATVGGTVAANASGPWRAGFGAARD